MAREQPAMSGETEDGAGAGGTSVAGSAEPHDGQRPLLDPTPAQPRPDPDLENRLKEQKDRIDKEIENQFRDQGAP